MADFGVAKILESPLKGDYLVCPECFNAVPINEEFVCDLCDSPLDKDDLHVD